MQAKRVTVRVGRNRRPRVPVALVLAVVVGILLAGCSATGGRPQPNSGGSAGSGVNTPRITVAVISHSAPGDTFWDIVRRGAEEAAAKDNINLLYTAQPEGAGQAQLVQQAIDQKVSGIAVTLAKPDAMKTVLANAKAANIPVVAINAGAASAKELGARAFFGADDRIAGEAVGQKLLDGGYARPICVIHEQGNVGLEERCAGVKAKIPATEILYVQGSDMTQVSSTITSKLQATAEADAVIGLGAPYTLTALRAVQATGSKAKIASFDLNADLAQQIKDGKIIFTVDQQPWLQGYLAVEYFWQQLRGGFEMGGGQPVLTGPAIVDQGNVDAVLKFAQEGIR